MDKSSLQEISDPPEEGKVRIKLENDDGKRRTGKHIFAEEKRRLREVIYAHHIQSDTEALMTIICHRTAYRRLILTATVLEGYPNVPLHVEAKSKSLPEKLLIKLCTLCETEVLEPIVEQNQEHHVESQLFAVYDFFNNQIMTNRLLYATPEIRQIRLMISKTNSVLFSIKEKEGLIKAKLVNGKYYVKVNFTVPDEYPIEQLQVDFAESSFPKQVSNIYLNLAREGCRKIALGIESEKAFGRQEELHTVQKLKNLRKQKPQIRLTNSYLQGLKHDVAFLKKSTDLQNVDSSFNKQLHKHEYSTATRRAARRELKKLSRQEMEAENKREEEDARLIEIEQLKSLGLLEEKSSGRSLKAVFQFLLKDFVQRMPEARSPISGVQVFPSDPQVLKRLIETRNPKRPIRASCGCWYTFEDLDKFLTEPPFGKNCPADICNAARVFHKDWPTDIKKLEKAWAMKKAREREINEISDFFGLSDEFSK